MYSNIKNVQILVVMLKAYEIKDVVMCPGGSDIPIIHSIEEDSYFNCYSVVDERSAVYFGIGVSQIKNAPVACICTSGTAVSNFLPGMTEACYQNVPIVAVTADKDPYFTYNLKTQKIDQQNIFGTVCKKFVELPIIHNKEDSWYCERLISEALLELNHHGCGPVHINLPIIDDYSVYDCKELPTVKTMNITSYNSAEADWKEFALQLEKVNKILIFVGQNVNFSEEDIGLIEEFFKRFNCMISVEHLSNINCKGCLRTYPVTEMKEFDKVLVPDIVISMGNNVSSYKLKSALSSVHKSIVHWQIDEGGRVRDMFKALKEIFECDVTYFFKTILQNSSSDIHNDLVYYNLWKKEIDGLEYPELPFSNFYLAQELSKIIPAGSIVHSAILNSTRIMQHYQLNDSIRYFSNVGALGIDGCLSTFVGHAAVSEELAFCVIGDLSFFYDMNAAGIRHIDSNVRIILINNGGGSEFHFFIGKDAIPTLNSHIAAKHHKQAKGWIESLGFDYYSAESKEELDTVLPKFVASSTKPMFLEVFTDAEGDAKITREIYSSNKLVNQNLVDTVKIKLAQRLPESQKAKIRKFLKSFR